MKKIIFCFLVCVLALSGKSATTSAVINGMLVDATDTTGLASATVKLMTADKQGHRVAGVTTDSHGVFNIKDVKPGRYIVQFSYLGYDTATRRVLIGADGRDVNLGMVKMSMTGAMLDEVVVSGVKTPITVKEDTIEFNADTYKTQANAVVEDLLKRLPGVEVGSDGKITANGKSVTKILIDGKEFFSDDPTVASKNIPANMVNKLQVIDRKSDLARLTGVDDGEDETVINLTVKKGVNNGWFGTVNAGYGTHSRYEGSVMANYFNNGNQYTLMGGANNTSDLGFSDGGAMRFRRFGGEDDGVTKSQHLGFNFNIGSNNGTDETETFRAGGDVLYSRIDRDTRTATARQYLFAESNSYYNSNSTSRDKGHNLRGDFRLKWHPDSANTLEFRPNFSFNFSESSRIDSSMTLAANANLTPVNSSLNKYYNDGKSYEFGGQLVFNHKFLSHPGRSFSAQARYNFSKINEDGNSYSRYVYLLKNDLDETLAQIFENHRRTNGVRGRLTWTEPLGDVKNARFLTLAYRGNYRYSRANKMVYDLGLDTTTVHPMPGIEGMMGNLYFDPAFRSYIANTYGRSMLSDGMILSSIIDSELGEGMTSIFNDDLSNQFRNTYFNQAIEVGFRQVRKAYNLNVGFSVNSAMSKSEDLINSARNIDARWVWTVAPFARMNYRFSKTRNLSLNYRMRSSQPSLTQLQPVADKSNPLNIVLGNPNLKPTFAHRFHLRYGDFSPQSQRSIMGMIIANFEQNSIVSRITHDALTGARSTTYANVNGVWSAMAMGMTGVPFTRSKVMFFTTQFFTRYSQTKGFNNDLYNRSGTWQINIAPGIAYRNGMVDVELRPRYTFLTTHNSLATLATRNVHTYGGRFDATLTLPMALVLSTDLSFNATSGYSGGFDNREWLWNASLGYQFLADKTASVQVSVFDILNQEKNVRRNVTAGYIDDLSFNNLGRYGMVTFTYRFSTFKKGQQPRDRNHEGRFGPGAMPPSGHPPVGRPHGGRSRHF